jgi:hypothetical protein
VTIRRVLLWYLGSLAFVAATGASGYHALQQVRSRTTPAQEASAQPIAPVADTPAPDATPPIPLPALRPHIAAATPARPSAHAARPSSPARRPTRQVATARPARHYVYRTYYLYESGYPYYVAYPGYAYYPAD